MRQTIIFIILLSTFPTFANPLKESAEIASLVKRAEAYYARGDKFFPTGQVDSVLVNYIRARKIINTIFFELLEAKKIDSLATSEITRQWDQVVSTMQVKLATVSDCEFDRCYIYQEEKVANWCIQILENAELAKQKEVLQNLNIILEKDAKSQYKDIFDKIYNYIRLKNSLRRLQLRFATPETPVKPLDPLYLKFLKIYQDYKSNLTKD